MLRPAPPERCCIVPKNSGIATGSKPEAERMPMPTRSASASLARVKLIWLWAARPCAAVTPPSTASLGRPVVAPIRIAASIAAIDAMFARPAFCSERAMWRCVTCAISCASTPASSASLRVAVTRPAFTPMNPPGRAKALMPESRTAKNVKRCAPSCAWLDRRMPRACRYSLISGSSTIWPASRSCRTIISPILYSSASDNVVLAGVPMSGSSLPVVCARAAGMAGCELQDQDGQQRAHRALPGGNPVSTARRAHGSPPSLRALRRRNRRAASARRAPASRGPRAASRGSG